MMRSLKGFLAWMGLGFILLTFVNFQTPGRFSGSVGRQEFLDSLAAQVAGTQVIVTDSLQQPVIAFGGIIKVDSISSTLTRVVIGDGTTTDTLWLIVRQVRTDTVLAPNGSFYVKDDFTVLGLITGDTLLATATEVVVGNGQDTVSFEGDWVNADSLILNYLRAQYGFIDTLLANGSKIVLGDGQDTVSIGGDWLVGDSLTANRAVLQVATVDTLKSNASEIVIGDGQDTVSVEADWLGADSLIVNWLRVIGQRHIKFYPPDSSVTGDVITAVAGEALTFGRPVFVGSTGKMFYANGDSSDAHAFELPAVYLVADKAGIGSGASGTFLRSGYIRAEGWAWTIGGVVYQDTVEGRMRQGVPSVTGHFAQVLGVADSADIIDFRPDLTIVEK